MPPLLRPYYDTCSLIPSASSTRFIEEKPNGLCPRKWWKYQLWNNPQE
ncbi:MAG: hypothetical protein HZA48_07220 [Planctomycetes bacterium]|nr:hypothetical protein [Planctomycetota bacterium]